MTILLNTGCHDHRSVSGSTFWLGGWPLPFTATDYGTGTTRTFMRNKCWRVVICEGAEHDGTTYTTLGTVTKYWLRKQAPALALVRPVWQRGERDILRWSSSTWFAADGYNDASGPPSTVSWIDGAATSFDLTTSGNRQRIFDGLIQPQPPDDMPAGILAAASAGAASVFIGAVGASRYNSAGYATGKLLVRIGTADKTIYQATIVGTTLAISPSLQFAAAAGTAVTFVSGIPMPPDIPHDLLLECEVYEFVTWLKPTGAPPSGGGKVSAQLAGIRITPHLYYWKCEPRAYYA